MLKPGQLAGGLTLAAAVAAQVASDDQMLKVFSDMSEVDQFSGVLWLIALAATIAAAIVCFAGPRVATLWLAISALLLNVLATAISAIYSAHLGFPVGPTLKLDILGIYPNGGPFSSAALFGGLITWVLLAVAIVLVATVRDATGPARPVAPFASPMPAPMQMPAPVPQQPSVAAGWYPHPSGNGSLGYWDGVKWLDIPAPQS